MSWDDGVHAKVKRVQLTYDDVIHSIQVTYEGSLQSERRGSVGPNSDEFTLQSDEYIKSISAYRKALFSQEVITSFTFTTNKSTYGPYGNQSGQLISVPEMPGQQIAGFHGSSSNVLNAIHVHYAPVPTGTVPEPVPVPIPEPVHKLEAEGGTGGMVWDDGFNYDGLVKIYAGFGPEGIQFVKFDYMKGGELKEGAIHGEEGTGSTKEFVINHPDEYLVSVEAWYDSSNVILGIEFKTNQKTSEYIGYDFDGTGTKFTLEVQDKKIIGFHGSASNHLNSIGAYLVPIDSSTTPVLPVKKLEAKGGETGAVWDDSHHDNVKKVYVGQGHDGIAAVKFEYINGSQVVIGDEHGKKTGLGFEDFEFESDEYITSMEGTYDEILGPDSAVMTLLIFKTNKNKIAGPFGLEGSTPFEFKEEGHKIAGFHGRASESIHAIGVYLAPLSTIPLTPASIEP